eukprot:1160322-Pelagomonas_calceolata.AAC.7
MGCAHGERQQPQVYIIPRDLCLPPGTAGGCDLEPLPFQAEAFVGCVKRVVTMGRVRWMCPGAASKRMIIHDGKGLPSSLALFRKGRRVQCSF